jgi:hypothetical protein
MPVAREIAESFMPVATSRTTSSYSSLLRMPPNVSNTCTTVNHPVRCGLMVEKIARRVFRINDQIQALVIERGQVTEELEFHRHINDDAQRDAAVSGSREERLEAGATKADVKRFERRLRDIARDLEKLERKRQALLAKLD